MELEETVVELEEAVVEVEEDVVELEIMALVQFLEAKAAAPAANAASKGAANESARP